MVLEIKIRNFFSIKEEVCLDFRAAGIKTANARMLRDNVFEADDTEILKAIVMYGANASGKSNIIKAIRFCHLMVLASHNHNEGVRFNFKPFKFGGFDKKPSSYFIRFINKGIEYEYAFTLTETEILTESLHYYPKGRIKEIFTRDERKGKAKKDKYSFGDVIRRPMDVAENTSNKTLYVSRASQMDREIAKEIFTYFNETFILNYVDYGIGSMDTFSKENKAQLIEALKIADSDIVDVKIKPVKVAGKKVNADLSKMTLSVEEGVQERLQITTYHKGDPSRGFDFLTEESHGTIKMFFIMLTVMEVVKSNKILLIDEIEESLHPKIIEYIFNFFRAGEKAQLLCSTHNTRFLDLKKFRKDQIYFVNKKDDSSTELYSLYDYSDFRDTMDLEKAYLQGRFNAIPFVNDTLSRIQHLIHEQAE